MTTIEALQNLYEALGGEASAVENINTIPAMLSEISEQLSGGGGGLPDVTAEDDGKVLKVVDGEWDKAESNTIIIRGHQRNEKDSIYWAGGLLSSDIYNLCKSGKNIIVVVYYSESDDTARKFFRPMHFYNNLYHFTNVSRVDDTSTRIETFKVGNYAATNASPNVKIIQDPTE